jgi:nucleoside phosphorylase
MLDYIPVVALPLSQPEGIVVKVLIICPFPPEFNACREILGLRDIKPVSGCRSAKGTAGNIDVFTMESGPAKARAAAATVAGSLTYSPDLVVDSGSCAGTEPGAFVGQLILCRDCFEYDIGGSGFPTRSIPEMKLPSALSALPSADRETLLREAGETGSTESFQVHVGNQACGELLIQSQAMREALYSLFQASGANWESAGVFVGALKNRLPPLSIRIVTDLGNEQALNDFRSNIKKQARELYRYIQVLSEYGWFNHFLDCWQKLGPAVLDRLPQSVLPGNSH